MHADRQRAPGNVAETHGVLCSG
uniref:Uncharacterized protein n=1 Tax=Anguilla anguilla TaxID=7936 RepID=A0A0E9RS92_ANGAN